MKKWLKITLIILSVFILALAILAILFHDTISIFRTNEAIHGAVTVVPADSQNNLIPVTKEPTDWPYWRGLNDSRAWVEELKTDWTDGLEKLWEVNYLCSGTASAAWGAPSIQGRHLIVQGRLDSLDAVFCLNAENGSLIWKKTYAAPAGASYGAGARATPYIDGDRVYTFSRSGDLICRNLYDGSEIWKQNAADAGGEEHTWGHSSSPLITDKLAIINGGGTARTLAYDKYSGELRWKSGQGSPGYAALSRIVLDTLKAVLTFHGTGLAALNPDTGEILWDTEWKTSQEVNASTPVISGNKIFITSGYGNGCQLLEAGPDTVKILWTNQAIASHHSDPFIIDGFIYGYSGLSVQNRGSFKCLDMNTGEEKWSTNAIGWGTGLQLNDFLLTMDIKGNLYLVEPSPQQLNLITRFPSALGNIRGAAWTMPVIAGGRLYLRFKQKLICYELTKTNEKRTDHF